MKQDEAVTLLDPVFCWNCGRIVQGEGIREEDKTFCDEKCQKRSFAKERPKVRKKYGVAGWVYDGYRYK